MKINLRNLSEQDAPFMLEWMTAPDVNRYFRFDPTEVSEESVLKFIRQHSVVSLQPENLNLAVTDENSDEYLGTVSLKNIDYISGNAEYAISLRAKARNGKGFGYSATKEILRIAFDDLKLSKVYLNVFADNTNAVCFYEKFGFVLCGIADNHIKTRDGKLHSLRWYEITDEKFRNLPTKKAFNTVEDVQFLEFPKLGDERGHLVVIEAEKTVPFKIQRAFYIYGSDAGVIRGQHANRLTKFVLINVSGESSVKAIDKTGAEKIFVLDRPHTGVYLPEMIWKDMYNFSADSVLLVLASEHYDGAEYIRDFNIFLSERSQGGDFR